jgi:hypothetical protein
MTALVVAHALSRWYGIRPSVAAYSVAPSDHRSDAPSDHRSDAPRRLAVESFRRDVPGGAHDLTGHRQRRFVLELGDAEVRQKRPAVFVEKDVARLDIAVKDCGLVRVEHVQADPGRP